MQKHVSIKPTIAVLLFSLVFSALTFEYWMGWQRGKSTPFTWDVELYYSYLPAAFIHHDLTYSYPNTHPLYLTENGNKIPKYTCGMAIMYAPFFFLGHKIAINQHSPLDGFSEPYATCVHAGSIFYVLLGLFFLRRVLLRFFSEAVSAVLLFIAYFGTNLFFYTMVDGEYTHGYLFFLVSLFTYLVIRWHDKPSYGRSVGAGLVLGLITLIRPTDIFFVFIFLLYGVFSKQTFRDKVQLLLQHKWKVIVMAVCVFIGVLPQIIYWKLVTGKFLYFSYGDEGFFWSDPRIWEVLFSYRKGWLVYTPVMILSIVGFFFLKKYAKAFLFAIPVFFILNLYVVSSWWCWWYGGSFGMRALIDSYPLMLIAMGCLLTYIVQSASRFAWLDAIKKYGVLSFIMFCVCLNLIQIYQYKLKIIHFDSMNKAAYWHVFDTFEFKTSDEQQKYYHYLSNIDYEKAKEGKDRRDY